MSDIQAVLDKASETIGFFASVIKSGEPWTEQCEQAKKDALTLLHDAALRKQK